MFIRGLTILASSAMDVGNIPAPRPWDALEAALLRQSALQAVQAELEFMPVSQRLIEPERYVALQETRRALLERFSGWSQIPRRSSACRI